MIIGANEIAAKESFKWTKNRKSIAASLLSVLKFRATIRSRKGSLLLCEVAQS